MPVAIARVLLGAAVFTIALPIPQAEGRREPAT